ncbi:MAG: hypothetical protein LBL45_08655 [Treponema sp.]|nr:hypothetical protein [Treponema sp.]
MDWRELTYNKTFEQEVRGLERRRASTACAIEEIESLLESLYNLDGDNWIGRGEVQDIVMAATIAAHEHFLAEWRTEDTNHTNRIYEPHELVVGHHR